ncbi:kinesin protein KIF28P, partial [Biomphalaria glabrata]
VLFGPSHLYVFHHPQDEAKQIKAGKVIEKPTYDSAQEEIAKESGLVDNKANKSKEELLLNEDLIQVLPMVYEANAMSEELDKKVKFEICLVSPKTRGLKEGMSEVMVQLRNLENGNSWLLSRNNFINRKYLMQEMFQNYTEGDPDWNVPKEKDPFWEPVSTPVLIGTSLVYLQPLAYLIDMDESLAVIDWKGKEIGQLLVSLVPCDSKWEPLSDSSYVEDPKELLGKPYYFKFKIKGARGIPGNFEKSSCSYKFYLEDKPTLTQEVKGTMNPDYQHERQISFKTVTDQLITYLTNEAILVEVWGQQKEEGMRSGSTNSNTKELMMKEKTNATPTPPGAAVSKHTTSAQNNGGKSAAQLASEIQDRIKKAKEKGIKTVPIEDIESALAQITGAGSGANSKSTKGTSRACLLQ